ncbi:methyltransferase domain-containing protein [Micromonospora rubida]|uniref:methyltransferase domain-containing protein n=1 Tax=Micromonospora rubida TaxID=2697657 RepID=UPI001377AE88|nr:methyltransferase domain-containing protein [Micromonospora rubida]NBE84314.1 methyltransferase domain-containing protein [Micromonospora rubida]
MWDPAAYLRYDDERGRPFHDLAARVPAGRPRVVVDLGCGPGTLTANLTARWPGARINGLDSSAEMIDRATALGPPVDFAVGCAALLTGAGCAVDAWETTYVHLLPALADADHPVLTRMEGTALRPARAALDDARWADFRTGPGARLAAAYPVRSGLVSFPFRRVFIVARTGARAEENS